MERALAQLQAATPIAAAPAADAITRAFEHMRFARTYDSGGPFRNQPFGSTPRMPDEPLWPAHAAAFASLATEVADLHTAKATHSRVERRHLADLVAALTDLQRKLLFDADCAESTDSLNTMRQYLQAAGYLDLAAAALASLV